jgi:hypothetical protein
MTEKDAEGKKCAEYEPSVEGCESSEDEDEDERERCAVCSVAVESEKRKHQRIGQGKQEANGRHKPAFSDSYGASPTHGVPCQRGLKESVQG